MPRRRPGLERYRIEHEPARPRPGGPVMEVAFSADGRYLYTVQNAERPLAVWALDGSGSGSGDGDGDGDGQDRPRPRPGP